MLSSLAVPDSLPQAPLPAPLSPRLRLVTHNDNTEDACSNFSEWDIESDGDEVQEHQDTLESESSEEALQDNRMLFSRARRSERRQCGDSEQNGRGGNLGGVGVGVGVGGVSSATRDEDSEDDYADIECESTSDEDQDDDHLHTALTDVTPEAVVRTQENQVHRSSTIKQSDVARDSFLAVNSHAMCRNKLNGGVGLESRLGVG